MPIKTFENAYLMNIENTNYTKITCWELSQLTLRFAAIV